MLSKLLDLSVGNIISQPLTVIAVYTKMVASVSYCLGSTHVKKPYSLKNIQHKALS